jgi:uncharacterized membrane protein
VARTGRAFSTPSDVHDELHDLGHLLDRPQTQLNHLARSDRSLSWIHMLFLFAVSITPFSTTLLAEYPGYRTALLLYWVNILLLGSSLYFSWVCAMGTGLVKDDLPPEVPVAIKRRIVVGQLLYAFGALLCVFSTYWSVAVIVLVQLNYAIAPFARRERT